MDCYMQTDGVIFNGHFTVLRKHLKTCQYNGEISGSHGDEYEDGCLLPV
jgi:hypothetical protein